MKLSDNAAAALENIREAQGVEEEQDTRITADQEASGGLALRLEFVAEVPESDQLVEQAGTEVYVDEKLVQPLENTVMDVREAEEGLAFVFKSQTP
jgi:Fe-S cluster assembly iron-binding protein IscA